MPSYDAFLSVVFDQPLGLSVGFAQVEVLFVLCSLLGGKRKAEVQDRLAKLGIVRRTEANPPFFKTAANPPLAIQHRNNRHHNNRHRNNPTH